ncbi:hypothetical protein PSDVSF_12240 [Pseudodesulfovibrio sediminis]|uniref:Methyltransferase FkbM domain-containing protein n=2 Tax=Pseudodesulfovibrio sediminis TaxID=2810563 RepID=A0ABM7P530_9BACT|nr:hypothetical protein PSDVSF_12240 [Pseudodesulfovibrio sediminis]
MSNKAKKGDEESVRPATCAVATRWGKLQTLSADTVIGPSLGRYGEWAQQEIGLCSALLQKGDGVVLAGANIGVQTIAYAQAVGPEGSVLAFEPQPEIYELLRLNVADNTPDNVTLHKVGLGNAEGVAYLEPLDYNASNNFGAIALSHSSFSASDREVNIKPLDAYAIASCRLLVVDCEGMEMDILRGAEATIARHTPCIYVESNTLEQAKRISSLLDTWNYQCFFHSPRYWTPDNHNRRGATADMEFAREFAVIGVPDTATKTQDIIHEFKDVVAIHGLDDIARIMFSGQSERVKLYWSGESDAMSETNSQTWAYPLCAVQKRVRAEINGVLGPTLRIDPCTQPTFFSLRSLRVRFYDGKGRAETVLQLPNEEAITQHASFSGVTYAPTLFGDLFCATSPEAHIAIPMPESCGMDSGQWVVEFDIRWLLSAVTAEAGGQLRMSDQEHNILEQYGKIVEEFNENRQHVEDMLSAQRELCSTINHIGLSSQEFGERVSALDHALSEKIRGIREDVQGSDTAVLAALDGVSKRQATFEDRMLKANADLTGLVAHLLQSRKPSLMSRLKRWGDSFLASSWAVGVRHWRLRRDTALVKDSGLFDPDYYLRNNPDVERDGMDPLLHFMQHGYKELRRPCESFDPRFYVSMYPDVESKGINPLLHYLLWGRAESRLPRPQSLSTGETGSCESPLQGTPEPEVQVDGVESVLSRLSERLRGNDFVVVTSHDNYTVSVGGVQAHMLHEQNAFTNKGVAYLHMYPLSPLASVSSPGQEVPVGVNLNGKPMGTMSTQDFSSLGLGLKAIQGANCRGVIIQHLLGWDLDAVEVLSTMLKTTVIFWLHDFFTVCPQYTLLRNERVYCDIPHPDSNSCLICLFGELRRRELPRFRTFFQHLSPVFLTPSEASKELWCSEYPEYREQVTITPHVVLHDIPDTESNRHTVAKSRFRPNIAYVGYPMPKKGWLAWRNFIDRHADISSRYNCFHLGNGKSDGRERFAEVNVTHADPEAMVRALREHDIDMVILWSTWPETFSYVMYEAVSAGCFILTHKQSGNIARAVERWGWGKVFDSEEALFAFLADEETMLAHLDSFRREHSAAKRMEFTIRTPELLLSDQREKDDEARSES